VIAADGELVTVTVASTVADGDLLVCGDGEAGAAVSFGSVAASLSDGDPIYTLGRAQAAAASGGTVTMLQNVQLIFASIPA
jgi:predicted RecA/RadA family phage recombinase